MCRPNTASLLSTCFSEIILRFSKTLYNIEINTHFKDHHETYENFYRCLLPSICCTASSRMSFAWHCVPPILRDMIQILPSCMTRLSVRHRLLTHLTLMNGVTIEVMTSHLVSSRTGGEAEK